MDVSEKLIPAITGSNRSVEKFKKRLDELKESATASRESFMASRREVKLEKK